MVYQLLLGCLKTPWGEGAPSLVPFCRAFIVDEASLAYLFFKYMMSLFEVTRFRLRPVFDNI